MLSRAWAKTAGQPSRALGYAGDQPVASFKRRFEIRCDRMIIRNFEPPTSLSQDGGVRRLERPSSRDSASTYSRLVKGSSSTTLYEPAGAPRAATTAAAASSVVTGDTNAAGEPKIGATPSRASLAAQHTPMGDLLVLQLEGKSPEEAFAAFGADNSPFGQWFKEQVKKAHGVDFTQPPPGPPPELIFEWQDNS